MNTREAYRGEGCKGTVVRAAPVLAALRESGYGPNRKSCLVLDRSALGG
jgi:hypothetical protein